ncbi:MAG: hypothetical protein KIT69_14210 [Propionibacteriaceae bacterium]|nr:hypothetical protein [Propionibacteriaceae bacterium]
MADRTYTDPRTGEVHTDVEPRSFDLILRELGEGSTLSELSETFWNVIQRVQETAKAGKLTLTLNVGFDGQGRLVVKDEVTHKLPEFSRPETRFFVGKDGNASRRDPNQPTLPSIDDARAKREQEAN